MNFTLFSVLPFSKTALRVLLVRLAYVISYFMSSKNACNLLLDVPKFGLVLYFSRFNFMVSPFLSIIYES